MNNNNNKNKKEKKTKNGLDRWETKIRNIKLYLSNLDLRKRLILVLLQNNISFI